MPPLKTGERSFLPHVDSSFIWRAGFYCILCSVGFGKKYRRKKEIIIVLSVGVLPIYHELVLELEDLSFLLWQYVVPLFSLIYQWKESFLIARWNQEVFSYDAIGTITAPRESFLNDDDKSHKFERMSQLLSATFWTTLIYGLALLWEIWFLSFSSGCSWFQVFYYSLGSITMYFLLLLWWVGSLQWLYVCSQVKQLPILLLCFEECLTSWCRD